MSDDVLADLRMVDFVATGPGDVPIDRWPIVHFEAGRS